MKRNLKKEKFDNKIGPLNFRQNTDFDNSSPSMILDERSFFYTTDASFYDLDGDYYDSFEGKDKNRGRYDK